jgi:hypothetical protein
LEDRYFVDDFQALIEKLDKVDCDLEWWENFKIKTKELIKTHSCRITRARGNNLTTIKNKLENSKNYKSLVL